MKDVLRFVALLVFAFLVVFGVTIMATPSATPVPAAAQTYGYLHCQPRDVYESQLPQVITECLDPSLEDFVPAWRTEIARRWHDPCVVILCHGGEPARGVWAVMVPGQPETADDLVIEMQRKYPNRILILLACNPGHLALKEHGVFHSISETWCVPDHAVTSMEDISSEDRALMGTPATKPSFPPIPFPFEPAEEDEPPHVSGPTRWQAHPDVCGNAFELICD